MAISTIQAMKKLKMMNIGEKWGSIDFTMAALMFVWTIHKSYFPSQLRNLIKVLNRLTFHKKHREIVTTVYLKHVLDEGKEIGFRERRRKLYTNCKSDNNENRMIRTMWSHVKFEHPAIFDTLAMEPDKKKEIMDDLINFRTDG
ncbi:OLC1v1004980C1, partial [Oldenlandia corymbosa var. corymbosa]